MLRFGSPRSTDSSTRATILSSCAPTLCLVTDSALIPVDSHNIQLSAAVVAAHNAVRVETSPVPPAAHHRRCCSFCIPAAHHAAAHIKIAENIVAAPSVAPLKSLCCTTCNSTEYNLLHHLQLSPLHHLQCPQVPVAAAARSGLRVKKKQKAPLPVLHLGCHPFIFSSWLHLQPLPPVLPSLSGRSGRSCLRCFLMLQSCHRHGPSAIVFLPSLCWGRSAGAVHPQTLPALSIPLPLILSSGKVPVCWANQSCCAVSCSNCSLTEPLEKPSGLRATRNAACDDKQVLPYGSLEQ